MHHSKPRSICLSRSHAISQYSFFVSIRTHCRCKARAAMPVVPLPQKGSMMRELSRDNSLIKNVGRAMGNAAGCPVFLPTSGAEMTLDGRYIAVTGALHNLVLNIDDKAAILFQGMPKNLVKSQKPVWKPIGMDAVIMPVPCICIGRGSHNQVGCIGILFQDIPAVTQNDFA